jgi:hypothetical protein
MTDLAYAFDEGSGTTAAEINGGLGLTGVPGWAAGLHGTAMYANGVLGPEWDPMIGPGDFTIMFDFYIVSTASYNIFMSGGVGNPQLAPGGSGFEWYPLPINVDGSEFPLATWRNMALVAEGTARRVLLDGVVVGSAVSGTPMGGDPIQLLGFSGLPPNMRMDNLRFFDSALSTEEIADLAGTDVAASEPPENVPPTANAGPNQSVYVGQQVTLTGSGTDTDGTIASYAWTQTSGPAVTLAGAGANRTFTPTVAGSYVFALVVTDDDGAQSVPDAVTVTVTALPSEPTGAGAELLNTALVAFTGCVGAAVEDICSYGLTIGETYVPFDPDPDDDCDESDVECSQVWVRVMNVAPAPAPEGWDGDCALTLRLDLEVGVLRCLEIEDGGEAPTATDVLAAAVQAMTDMNAILCAAMGCEVWDAINVGQWTPSGPLGGQYGGTWTFTVEI